MENESLGGLFVCEDYVIEPFEFGDVSLNLYCLKASVTDFDLTGQIIWPAAVFLSEYIVNNRKHFENKKIIELGSGTGLSGFIAAKFAKQVLLTDNHDVVVKLLDKNVDYLGQENIFACNFNWGTDKLANLDIKNAKEKTFSKEEKIDMIIGADIIFWPESLDPLMETLNVHTIMNQLILKEALDINKDCEILISFFSRNQSVDKNLEQKIEKHNLKREIIANDGQKYLFKIFR